MTSSLNVGMKVNAVCMGRVIGNYVVSEIHNENVAVLSTADGKVAVFVDRHINPQNNSVRFLTRRNNKKEIQCTEYYVQ